MDTRTTILVTAGILSRDGKVLLAQRKPGSDLALKWEFPGGKVEPGETPEDCISRELREELAVDVFVEGIYHAVVHDYPEYRVVLLCYRCTVVRGEPRPLQCRAVKWVTPAEMEADARKGLIAPADMEVVKRLLGDPAVRDCSRGRLC